MQGAQPCARHACTCAMPGSTCPWSQGHPLACTPQPAPIARMWPPHGHLTGVLQPVDDLLPEALRLVDRHGVRLHDDGDDGHVLGQLSHVPACARTHMRVRACVCGDARVVCACGSTPKLQATTAGGGECPRLAAPPERCRPQPASQPAHSPHVVLPQAVRRQAVEAHIHARVLHVHQVDTPARGNTCVCLCVRCGGGRVTVVC
jgi:hypothetical protein